MQEKQENSHQNDERLLSTRDQRLVEYLTHLWQSVEDISPQMLHEITNLSATLPPFYNTIGLRTIAQQTINHMNLHFLATIAIFQQNAGREGIDREEQTRTLEDILPQWTSSMANVSQHILVESLEDLVNISNITISLRKLYRADCAEDAQRILYELPLVYHTQLAQKGLLSLNETPVA